MRSTNKPCGRRLLHLVCVCAALASFQTWNESSASHRTSPSGHMMRLFCILGRAGPRECGPQRKRWPHSKCIPSPGPWELARPGDLWKRWRCALVSKQHGLAEFAGLLPSQKPIGFYPLMWTRCVAPHPAGQRPLWEAPGGGVCQKQQLVARAPPLSPTHLAPTCHSSWVPCASSLPTNRKWHWTDLKSPYVLDSLSRNFLGLQFALCVISFPLTAFFF